MFDIISCGSACDGGVPGETNGEVFFRTACWCIGEVGMLILGPCPFLDPAPRLARFPPDSIDRRRRRSSVHRLSTESRPCSGGEGDMTG